MIPTAWIKPALLLGAALLLAGLVFAGCETIYGMGEKAGAYRVQSQWDAEKARVIAAVDKRKDQQAQVTHEVETVYVDRWHTIVEQGKTITKEVIKYVPYNTPDLPGGFRLLHDAAAIGTSADALSEAASGAAPQAVSAQDVAGTVADNYTGCRLNAADLEAWNAWADKQEALSAMR